MNGKTLLRIRRKLELSQREFAKLLDCHQTYVSKIELEQTPFPYHWIGHRLRYWLNGSKVKVGKWKQI